MPKDMGYGYGSKGSDYGGSMKSSGASDAGASGRSYVSGRPPRNPKQKDAKGATGGYRNTVKPGDPGNKGY